MNAAIVVPGNTASTFLVHLFGTGLEDDRYVVERFKAHADGDIRPWSGEASGKGAGRRRAKGPCLRCGKRPPAPHRRGLPAASPAPAGPRRSRHTSGRCRSSTRSSPSSTSKRATSTAPATPGRTSRWRSPSPGAAPSARPRRTGGGAKREQGERKGLGERFPVPPACRPIVIIET